MEGSVDRRVDTRFGTGLHVRLHRIDRESHIESSIGFIVNVSAAGLLCGLEAPVGVPAMVNLEIELPSGADPSSGSRTIKLFGRTTRCWEPCPDKTSPPPEKRFKYQVAVALERDPSGDIRDWAFWTEYIRTHIDPEIG